MHSKEGRNQTSVGLKENTTSKRPGGTPSLPLAMNPFCLIILCPLKSFPLIRIIAVLCRLAVSSMEDRNEKGWKIDFES